MSTRIRALNASGCERFAAWLDNPSGEAPREILLDPLFSDEVEAEYWIDLERTFDTSYEVGAYLNRDVFTDVRDRFALNSNRGLWAWISLALINSLVRRGGRASGMPLARAHYIDSGPRHAYRLIARTAWNLVRLHGESAKVALASTSTPWGEMAEQMSSRQEIYVHPGFWPVACRLYMAENGTVRTGATTHRTKKARRDPKSKAGLGGVGRLPGTFRQFDRTYNTREMTAEEIIALLPGEYARWGGT